jgi:hypothetical protein
MNRSDGQPTAASPRRVVRRVLSLLVALSFVPACRTDVSGLDGVGSRQFQDVVVPSGFALRDRAHESYSREEGSWRQGHFVYTGSTRVAEAARYVKLRMPQHGWALIGPEPATDGDIEKAEMRFERGSYSAVYLIERRDGSTRIVVDYDTDYTRG